MMSRPAENEYPEYYKDYISLVPDGDIVDLMKKQTDDIMDFFRSIPEDKGTYRYEPEKWSIKEILGHLTDMERIFGYRALRFARNDTAGLNGYDQDDYVSAGNFDSRTLTDLADEFFNLRRANTIMYNSFNDEDMQKAGTADGNRVNVRSIAYILVGHPTHHINVIKDKYL